MLESAVSRLQLEATPHEGLFAVCVHYLQWIDIDRDLPNAVAADFRQWRAELLPEPRPNDGYGTILSTVRQLDVNRAREKIQSLKGIASALRSTR